MKIYQLYFFGNILVHLAIYFGYLTDDVYRVNWSEDIEKQKYFKVISSFFIGGTFVSGFDSSYVVPFFSGKNLGIFVSWWFYFTGLIHLRNTYKMMSEMEEPKHKSKNTKINFTIMIFFLMTTILGYNMLIHLMSDNAYVIQGLTIVREQMARFNLNIEILAVLQEPIMNYIPFHMAVMTAYYYKAKYYTTDFVLFNITNWLLPWLFLVVFVCLGMNNELGAFYDYTLFHMLSGILIGKVYSYLAYDKKLLVSK